MTHCVYWIHKAEHKDMLTQGYIGVTKIDRLNERLVEHRRGKTNPHLTYALKKYPDVFQTRILIGLKDYCYEIEERLRPKPEIGWNINKGGTCPPCGHNAETKRKIGLGNLGKVLSEETKAKMRKPKSEEHKQNLRKPKSEEYKRFCRTRKHTEETKEKIRQNWIKRKQNS